MVHDIWSTMFNWCYKTVYKELKIGRVRLKGGGVPWYYPLGDTLQLHYWYYIYTNSFVYIYLTFFPLPVCQNPTDVSNNKYKYTLLQINVI